MSSLTSSPRTLPRNCLRKWTPSPTIGRRTLVSRLSPRHRPSAIELGPESPHFAPRKWGQTTRLSMYYDNVVASDYLLMAYDPAAKRPKQILPLRWDGTSPYHKNRPQPREPQPKEIRYPIKVKTLPKIKSITVHTMMKSALVRKLDVLNAAQAFQSITGLRPTFIRSKSNIQAYKLRAGIPHAGCRVAYSQGIPVAVKVILQGPHMWAFLSTLTETVLPRIPDFEGIHFHRNERQGTIDFGFKGTVLALFPQIASTYLPLECTF
jgi:large subunit ribosomal protein L5